jgi:hypothetical protein
MKVLITLVVLSVSTILGQNAVNKATVCSGQDVKNISSRGIRLGMDQEEVLRIFSENGKLTLADGEYLQNENRTVYTTREVELQAYPYRLNDRAAAAFGYSFTRVVPKDAVKFDGIARYELGFLDKKLAVFRVNYVKPQWESQSQFIRKLSEILNLSVPADGLDGSPYVIRCGDHSVEFMQNQNDEARFSLQVSADVDGITRQRRKKAADELREKDIKAFKP